MSDSQLAGREGLLPVEVKESRGAAAWGWEQEGLTIHGEGTNTDDAARREHGTRS